MLIDHEPVPPHPPVVGRVDTPERDSGHHTLTLSPYCSLFPPDQPLSPRYLPCLLPQRHHLRLYMTQKNSQGVQHSLEYTLLETLLLSPDELLSMLVISTTARARGASHAHFAPCAGARHV